MEMPPSCSLWADKLGEAELVVSHVGRFQDLLQTFIDLFCWQDYCLVHLKQQPPHLPPNASVSALKHQAHSRPDKRMEDGGAGLLYQAVLGLLPVISF